MNIKEMLSKNVSVAGKTIPVAIIALLAVTGVSASLLLYYGRVTSTITVSQAVILSGTGCSGNKCSSTMDAVGTETVYSGESSITSFTKNDVKVKFANSCNPDCEGITVTNMIGLKVVGFGSGTDGFEPENYKKTYYDSPVGPLADLDNVTYSFKILNNAFSSSSLAPYVVLVGDGIGNHDVAVYMIPDGRTYNEGEVYTGVVDDSSLFHVPASSVCTQSSPCTLAKVKTEYPTAQLEKVAYAIGAFPDASKPELEVMMGLSEINGEQAVHKYTPVYGYSSMKFMDKYDFALDIAGGTYTVYTQLIPTE